MNFQTYTNLYKMLVEDLLHERYDEHPKNAAEGDYKNCASGSKPYLVVFDIHRGFFEVEMLLVRLSIFVMATVVMVTIVIMVVFFFIVAMVSMSIGFDCIHLLEEWG